MQKQNDLVPHALAELIAATLYRQTSEDSSISNVYMQL